VTCAIAGGFEPDELLAEIRTTAAYAELSDEEWQWALDFVVRGGETLQAYPDFRRVTREPDGRYIVRDRGIASRHRMTIGTIASEASMAVRFQSGGRLGHVEESFAAKLKPGDRFTFAGRTLEFIRIKDMTAWVKVTKQKANTVPRWMGGRMPLSTELAAAVRTQLDAVATGDYRSPELLACRPILELQAAWSRIPRTGELLIEQVTTKEGEHWYVYPFEGRLAHEGLAALVAYRMSRLLPITLTMAVNDYGFEVLAPAPLGLTIPDWRRLLQLDRLTEDISQSLNAAEMAKRQFRETARVAGLVSVGRPGANKSAKQLQASSSLFYDVFQEYDPGNLLLRQAQREVLEQQFEETRLRAALARIEAGPIQFVRPPKPTPLAFPLLVERLRGGLSSESLAERVRRMTAELEAYAQENSTHAEP
jgi:ATP-dependent Lhr-like helicase